LPEIITLPFILGSVIFFRIFWKYFYLIAVVFPKRSFSHFFKKDISHLFYTWSWSKLKKRHFSNEESQFWRYYKIFNSSNPLFLSLKFPFWEFFLKEKKKPLLVIKSSKILHIDNSPINYKTILLHILDPFNSTLLTRKIEFFNLIIKNFKNKLIIKQFFEQFYWLFSASRDY